MLQAAERGCALCALSQCVAPYLVMTVGSGTADVGFLVGSGPGFGSRSASQREGG